MSPWRNDNGLDWTRIILALIGAASISGNAGQFISFGGTKADAVAAADAQIICCPVARACIAADFLGDGL